MPVSTITLSLNSSLTWGKLTEAQIKAAVGDPAELPAETRQELRALLASHADGFEPAARAALEQALAAPERTFDPKLASWVAFNHVDNAGVSYQQVAGGQLFVGGVAPSDIQQGMLGDCYFLATLAGFAQSRPEVLQNAITDNHNGTFTARFFQQDPVYGIQPVYVTVDGDVPTRNGMPLYAYTPGGELWPALLEKAYARLKGSYGLIGNGGIPGQVAFDLTGDQSSMRLIGLTSQSGSFARMSAALAKGQPVMAATISEKLRPRDLPLTGLVPGHAYTVTKAFEQDGVEFVEVRNPWGAQPPISTPRGVIDSNGGTFTLTMEEFKAGFPAAFIAD